jgi:succinate dehydrogenase / fumarate reductase cytochrome b subunit
MEKSIGYGNRLGLKGWVLGGRWGFERYMYSIHRVTGLGILLYFLLHILVTTSRAFGMETWEYWMGVVTHPIFAVGEFLVYAAFCIHALNGIRLILVEFGIATGKPIEPVYPYRTAVHKQRPLLVVMMVFAALLVLLGGYDFFVTGH